MYATHPCHPFVIKIINNLSIKVMNPRKFINFIGTTIKK
jgi:hypothetical protein